MSEANGNWHHYRTCNLCEAMCGLDITLEGDTILSIKGDKADPFSQGHICPKATALQDVYDDPDRLKYPMRRTTTGWQRLSWEEAFDEVATKLKAIQTEHGRNAVGIYLGNPNVHNLGSMLFNAPFIRALRTINRFTATSVDQLPHHFVAHHMFGHQLLIPIPDVDRTDYFLILGANPVASNGSLMSAGGIEPRLKALQKRGGKVVVIDPRRNETARIADAHHFIRPGSDVLFLLSLIHVIFSENLFDLGHLHEITDGLATVSDVAAGYTPERVAAIVGIEVSHIRQIARDFASAGSAICYGRMGVSTQRFGGLCQWLINLLNILTGNFDRPGGVLFTTPAVDTIEPRRAGKYERWQSRVRGLPEFGGELPVATLAEEILTPGQGQIRAMVTVAGNPLLSTPNGVQLDEAFAGLDFMVAIDIYINETTRHAHIILPPTTGLETAHYDLVFHTLTIRNTAKYSAPLFTPAPDTRHDWQIYRELTKRLATKERPFDETNPMNQMTPEQMLDFGLRSGPYGQEGMSLTKLKENPHGIDLGPLRPQLPNRLFTPHKRIQAAPLAILRDVERVEATFFEQDHDEKNGRFQHKDALLLIGRRHLRSNNSWMHNSLRLVKGKNRCTLLIHPDDAAARHITDGQWVAVSSRVGQIEIEAQLSNEIMPGVVSIPHGWGHRYDGSQLRVAEQHAGVSVNDLTDELMLDALTGNAALNGVPVMATPLAL